MIKRALERFRLPRMRAAQAFADGDSGAVTIFAMIAFSMLIVVVGLVIDVGRVMNVHSQTSSYADRIALAAAAQLDGRSGALSRAATAVSQLGVGARLTLSGNNTIGVQRMEFMSSTNPVTITRVWTNGNFQPGTPMATADRTTRFVRVETRPQTENYLFFTLLGDFGPAMTDSATVTSAAVAGYERRVCNSAPIMVCNRDESTSNPNAPFNPTVGQRVHFELQGRRRQGDTNNWGRTTYSLLDVASLDPAALRAYVGQTNPGTSCYGRSSTMERTLNNSTQRREAIGRGFNDRYNTNRREFPAAVVNCLQHRVALDAGNPVPILGFALMRMRERVDLDDPDEDDEVYLENRGVAPASLPDENLREYPVLLR